MTDVTLRRLHWGIAAASFLIAFVTYLLTMQPTVPFWDCGEFAAAASALQVPHPPGAPLWTLVGRIAMILPTFSDPVARYNLFSVLSSAATVTLLYLTTVKLIRVWRGREGTGTDALITYGAAFVGALSFTWTDSFWFNAVECEVYAFGSLFIALILWLALLWQEKADEPGSERYLLLIAYVIGLSLGVHQLALLTLFPVFMIVYYRRRHTTTLRTWLWMAGVATATFLFIYVIVLTKLVGWAGHGKAWASVAVLAILVLASILAERKRLATMALLSHSVLLVFLGYTTYTTILVRAGQDPPMNQNVPSNFERLASYINRDQYGDWKLFPRRLPEQKEGHPETWTDYSSDLSFFLQYQTNLMFNRYLAWNFIGRQDDDTGAGVDPLKTFGLPFLLGLFGIYWHFRRDPKRALTVLAAFMLLGYLTAWYQNQQEPQPRERDYFYVGAFYVYAVWIAIGATGLLEMLRERRVRAGLIAAALGLIVVFVPLNQVIGLMGLTQGESFAESSKWAEYSRRHNRVPWEYAYNILQSCEPDAILFTYGDNDTFPLWALQDVYGIRRDVRIVQLQLANAMTYCRALDKPNDWGAKPIRLSSYADSVVNLPDTLAYPLIERSRGPVNISVSGAQAAWLMGTSEAQATRFQWSPQVHLPSDLLVADIVENNLATRPIYYAVTVPESERAGLNAYLVYEGLVARVTPFKQPLDPSGIGASIQGKRFYDVLFSRPASASATPRRGLILQTYSDPAANLSSMDKSYAMTYRLSVLRFVDAMLAESNIALAAATLDTMESLIPISRVPLEYPYASLISDLAEKSANWRIARRYASAGAQTMSAIMSHPNWRENDRYANQTDPEMLFADLLARSGDYTGAEKEFGELYAQSTGDRQALIGLKLEELAARKARASGDGSRADSLFQDVIGKYDPTHEHRGEFLDLWNWLERPPSVPAH